jgi:PAS domain S-box-containing protein
MNIKCADNTYKKVLVSITPVNHPEMGLAGIIAIFRDIREMANILKQLEDKNKELEIEKNKLEAIFNSKMEGTFTIDKEWNIVSFNKSAERITGVRVSDAIGRKCWDIFCKDEKRENCPMTAAIENKTASVLVEFEKITKNGEKIPVRVSAAPLFDGNGEHIGAVETFQDLSEIKHLYSHLEENYKFDNIIGRSKPMQNIYSLIENVSESKSIVLITGESGTGKEVVARAIHLNSDSKSGPFIALNCSAFAETLLESELFGHEKGAFTGAIKNKLGRFEMAKGGTLFLDEIGDISQAIQVKLLRVLETRSFERVGSTETIELNARIIAATNRDLEKAVRDGKFREDLYYRINVINIHLPPLRERKEDLTLLTSHLMKKFRNRLGKNIRQISPEVINQFLKYDWPGNIRELENVLEHAFIVCHTNLIELQHLPPRFLSLAGDVAATERVQEVNPLKNAEMKLIAETIKKHNGSRSKTAKELGIDKSTLWRKMKKYKLI